MRKTYYWILKNNRWIIYSVAAAYVIACGCWFYYVWCSAANYYSDNIIIEISTGIFLSSIPLLIGLDLGKKIESDLFYFRIRDLLIEIARKRIERKFGNKTTRGLVVSIMGNIGTNVTDKPWYKKLDERLKPEVIKKEKCGVCNLKVEMVNDHCEHCKLNCFAWLTKEEIASLKKIETENAHARLKDKTDKRT